MTLFFNVTFFFTLCCVSFFAGCSSIATEKNTNFRQTVNHKSALKSTGLDASDTSNLVEDLRQSPEAFIGIAFSGGGSRAANFSLGVSHALRELGLLQRADALSSVSGGSLPAAYLSINWNEFDADLADFKMRQDFLGDWLLHSINPIELAQTLVFRNRNSSDTLADTFDRLMFSGATFDNLDRAPEKNGPPRLLINAAIANRTSVNRTALYTNGYDVLPASHNGFTFTNEAFEELKVDRKDFSISRAVAASGAFPGAFAAVTIKDRNPPLGRSPINNLPFDGVETGYIHLIDGGVVDNLGINAILQAYVRSASVPIGKKTCLFILVDSHVSNVLERKAALSDLRTSPLDYLVSPTIGSTFDALLQQLRHRQLQRLGIDLASMVTPRYVENSEIGLWQNKWIEGNGWVSRGADYFGFESINQDQSNKNVKNISCDVWHISLDRILELTTDGGYIRRERSTYPNQPHSSPSVEDQRLEKIANFVSGIETNYRLSVIAEDRNCTSESIQDSLFAAGYHLVYGDRLASAGLTKWLKKSHLRSELPNGESSRLLASEQRFFSTKFTIKQPTWHNRKSAQINCN
jgi:NTE family protein